MWMLGGIALSFLLLYPAVGGREFWCGRNEVLMYAVVWSLCEVLLVDAFMVSCWIYLSRLRRKEFDGLGISL